MSSSLFSFVWGKLLCHSDPPQRAPGASPSAHNISSAAGTDRTNFPRGVPTRNTFHLGQQRGARDQQGSPYHGAPASPSLSHGNSQQRRPGASGIFSKFTSKFVRRWDRQKRVNKSLNLHRNESHWFREVLMAREETRVWWCEDECDESRVFSAVKFGLGGDEKEQKETWRQSERRPHWHISTFSHLLLRVFSKVSVFIFS